MFVDFLMHSWDLLMGASTVKWTTHDPCLVLSKSDSILCTNFEFCEQTKILYIFKTYSSAKGSKLWWPKKFQEKSTYFRRRCKWCARRWYWASDCQKFVLKMIKLHLIDGFLQSFVMMPSSRQWFQGIRKKNSKSKIIKAMKFTSKTKLNHLLLSTFDAKYWRSQLDILYLSI